MDSIENITTKTTIPLGQFKFLLIILTMIAQSVFFSYFWIESPTFIKLVVGLFSLSVIAISILQVASLSDSKELPIPKTKNLSKVGHLWVKAMDQWEQQIDTVFIVHFFTTVLSALIMSLMWICYPSNTLIEPRVFFLFLAAQALWFTKNAITARLKSASETLVKMFEIAQDQIPQDT